MTIESASCYAPSGISTRSRRRSGSGGAGQRFPRHHFGYSHASRGLQGRSTTRRWRPERPTLSRPSLRHAFDEHEGARLTDLPPLTLIKHHGAATPLLDVSPNPLVALHIAIVSHNRANDGPDGVVFAIRWPRDDNRPIHPARRSSTSPIGFRPTRSRCTPPPMSANDRRYPPHRWAHDNESVPWAP